MPPPAADLFLLWQILVQIKIGTPNVASEREITISKLTGSIT